MKKNRPDLDNEMDELQRISQDLMRDENVTISVDEIIKAFNKSEEETLTDDIWSKLENTDSNEFGKGDWDSVIDMANQYKKTDPKKLKKIIQNGSYKRPLILKLNDRYILVAGNTRLSTAAAMGINPLVFIAKINMKINKLKGGKSDNLSLYDLARKYSYDDSKDNVSKEKISKVLNQLNDQLKKGIKVEKEHTSDLEKATEIAMDHLSEDPKYYDKLEKIEAKEMTGASSSGSFEAPLFGSSIKKNINKINNSKKYTPEEEMKEATDSSSSGAYDVPFGDGSKNPLKIGGVKSIDKSRAVKDKNFPKLGGPGGKFVKIKEKCKKFPYCNQGDINALELYESNGYLYDMKKEEFINYINENITSVIKDTILESVGKKEVYIIKNKKGEPIEMCSTEEEAKKNIKKYNNKELIIEPGEELSIDELDSMGEKIEKNESMKNINEGLKPEGLDKIKELCEKLGCRKTAVKLIDSILNKKIGLTSSDLSDTTIFASGLDDIESMLENGDYNEAWSCAKDTANEMLNDEGMDMDMNEEKDMCSECGSEMKEGECMECGNKMFKESKNKVIRLSETQLTDLIKNITETIPGLVTYNKAHKGSGDENKKALNDVNSKIKEYLKFDGNKNPEFPKTNKDEVVARQNSEEDDEFVANNRGGGLEDLKYDNEPSDAFLKRVEMSLKGHSKMGNSNDAANVIATKLGDKIIDKVKKKKEYQKNAPMYNKDAQPTKEVKESVENKTKILVSEDIEKMKRLTSYNKKTQ